MAREKVVLAYSGGLDTSVTIKWLQEKYDLEVIALAVDVGQRKDLDGIREKASKIGAAECLVIDAKEAFAHDFILPVLKANALYENKYPLSAALSRPLIAKLLVETAEKVGAKVVAHGCTGKGNDQVRFELSISALNPNLRVLAPVREWSMSRSEAIKYAEKHQIPIPVTADSPYSIDENLWGRSVECGQLEDPWKEPLSDAYSMTRSIMDAANSAEYLEITFDCGLPTKLNGKETSLIDLINELNRIGGIHAIGRIDQIENRLVGIKSREIYECPAAIILITAHKELESLALTADVLHYKYGVEQKYAELVYTGMWYSPLKNALDVFMNETQKEVSGTIRIKLLKGNCLVTGRKSPHSLYDYSLATYDETDRFSHKSAEGFIEIWGLPLKLWAKKRNRK